MSSPPCQDGPCLRPSALPAGGLPLVGAVDPGYFFG